MTNTLRLQEWLDTLSDEYLTQFVKAGGSSIKFAVPLGGVDAHGVAGGLAKVATGMDYIVAEVDASDTRVHMAHEIFFRVASQVPWKLMARRVILRLAREQNYSVDGISASAEPSLLNSISAANSTSVEFVIQELRPSLEGEIYANRRMAKDFRVAMTRLCLAETWDTGESPEGSAIVDWLTGTNRRVSNVKRYSIYNAITRTNARHFFESLLYWTKFVGYSGVLAIIDDSRVTLRRNPRDGLRFYGRAMVMDHYELLREFIDGTDRLESFLMVVIADEEFLNDDRSGKGLGIYQALMGRIADEVRDRSQANPMSTLVRLADTARLEQPQ